MAMGVLGPSWHMVSSNFGEHLFFWGAVFVTTIITATVSLLPLVVLIVFAEAHPGFLLTQE